MRFAGLLLILACLLMPSLAEEKPDEGPTNEKARKTYKEGFEYLHRRMTEAALESFKKADKQDGGRCHACQQKMIKYGVELRDWKTAEGAAVEMVEQADGARNLAIAHYQFGLVLIQEGLNKRKDEPFAQAHEEMGKALAAEAKFPQAIFADGQALAHLKRDDAAKARFEEYAKMRRRTIQIGSEPCVTSASPNWHEPEWRRHSRLSPLAESGLRWTILREKSC